MQIQTVLGSRVLVKVIVDKVEDVKADDLVVAPQAINPNYFKGEVVKVYNDNQPIKVGDKVAFLKYGYEDMGDGQCIVEEAAILCTYQD